MSFLSRRVLAGVFACAVLAALVGAAPSFAGEPWWHLVSSSRPSYLAPEGEGTIVATVENSGDASVAGASSPVTITDVLPAGLRAVSILGAKWQGNSPTPFSCSPLPALTCTFAGSLAPYRQIEVRIRVKVAEEAHTGEQNRIEVSGGGAPPAAVERPITVSEEQAPFGVEDFELRAEEEGGALTTQAGSHPFQVTGTFVFNQGEQTETEHGTPNAKPVVFPAGLPKDIDALLPPGLIGDPTPFATCSTAQFTRLKSPGENAEENECPADTAVGTVAITFEELTIGYTSITEPVFKLEPAFGEPARFGFAVPTGKATFILDTALRSGPGEDYGITVSSPNTTEQVGTLSAQVTFWGVPGDPRHDRTRGWSCLSETEKVLHGLCVPSIDHHPPALLTMPTSCGGGPLNARAQVNAWLTPSDMQTFLPPQPLQTLDGCNQLPFSPLVSAQPSTDRASAPTGLDFNLDFHDEGLTSAEGLAQSQLNKTVVKLPEGLTINPSAGVGLGGCTPEDYARETIGSVQGVGCPNDSKLGTVEIETPLLAQKIHGNIFIAQPYDNPSGSLVALYVVAKNPEVGVLIKLAGKVEPDPVTGQLTTIFENNPPLAFSHFNFHFREGQQAPLISPPTCGTYTTQALMSPWSEPSAVITGESPFQITKGFDGGPCPSGGVPPFSPGIVAGTLNNNAGSFSGFYLRLSRTDAEQEISGFSTDMPNGLTGVLTGIPYCPESGIEAARQKTGGAEQAEPSCPASSQVGHTEVGTGVGAVLAYTPGKLYLAGPYNGDPFSLVSITSAVVGPFDLGTVVIRFGLRIDPSTGQVSVDPVGSEPIPTIIKGIVTHVRDIRAYVDRPNFILNPTDCDPTAISSTLNSDRGHSVTVSSRFQVTNCAALAFKPSVEMSVGGKPTRTNGTSVQFKIAYPKGALGKQAWMSKVRFALPKQIPARLSTIQQSCTAATFNRNPASCPAASRIGTVLVHTELLPVPLQGPVFFVSNGGAKFPEAVLVLQGDGVTVDVHAETNIDEKTGITSATAPAIPGVPFEDVTITLPAGPYSEFAATGNICKETKTVLVKKKVTVRTKNGAQHKVTRKVKTQVATSLVMPTSLVAQNGAEIHQNTPVTVTECPSTRRKQSKGKKASHGQKGGRR